MSAGARSTMPCTEHGASRRRESVARAALEDRYGRPLSDVECVSAKRNLLAFIRLLAEWERSPAAGKAPWMPVGNWDRT